MTACPDCGCECLTVVGMQGARVLCIGCGAIGPKHLTLSEKGAWAAWDQRACGDCESREKQVRTLNKENEDYIRNLRSVGALTLYRSEEER